MRTRRAFPYLAPATTVALATFLLFVTLFSAAALAQEGAGGSADQPGQTAQDPDTPLALACLGCHSDPAIAEKGEGLYVDGSHLAGSVHSDQPCTACHLQPGGVLHADLEAEREAARTSCRKCHEGEWTDWQASSHGQADAKGAPTCADCHSTHGIVSTEDREFVIDVANDRCAACHDERGESFYRYNYHGKESNLGRYDVAVCADCHGGHQVLPASDADSMVSEQNLVETCASCHPGGGENFADVQIHVLANPIPADPKLAAATVYFIIILTVTFGLFGWHMILAIKHEWRLRKAKAAAEAGDGPDEPPGEDPRDD